VGDKTSAAERILRFETLFFFLFASPSPRPEPQVLDVQTKEAS